MPRASGSYRVFNIANHIAVGALALLCLLPLMNILAISFSDRTATSAGFVSFWPVNPTLAAYEYVLEDKGFLRALSISVFRVIMGGTINLVLTLLCAYPLSRESHSFRARTLYVWFFLFSSLFSGGLIPTYMVVRSTGLINSLFALVIPCAVPIFHIILLMNYFRSVPREIEEAARIDGAGHWKMLVSVLTPISKASIATVTLFSLVNHWNSWFDGMIYANDVNMHPLATFLHNKVVQSGLDILINTSDMETLNRLMKVSDQTTKAAQIFLAMIPILCVYPFLQKYFAKGIIIGSVKG